ncbi:hypothetical protein UFOVP580_24 [uncultured Caudovirales phage]|uniref:Uncharacterized protein n=1 Tax=uncultured Caudovirales phage TaxID=2100421 RepID=A0A6J5PBY3_9CAUD|nr:hypothetical protein UFOVP580_24 [uncultured Caudovirales phage]
MPYLQARDSITLNIPAGQSIRVGNFRGAPVQMATVQSNRPNGPVINVPLGATTYGPYPLATDVTLTSLGYEIVEYTIGASPALTESPYNASNVSITGGSINNTSIGATTRNIGAFTQFALDRTDTSGTPGNATINQCLGRAAFAAAASTVVISDTRVTTNSEIFVQLRTADSTLTIARVTSQGAGTFTVTGNAAATAITQFSFLVVN